MEVWPERTLISPVAHLHQVAAPSLKNFGSREVGATLIDESFSFLDAILFKS